MVDISVVIPLYGDAPWLHETLESILTQENIENIKLEIVVVLDRPTPIIVETLNLHKSSRLRVLLSPGEGIVAALNFGVQNSNGRYIARIDADDFMDSKRLSLQYHFLESQKQVVVLGSQVNLISVDGSLISTSKYLTKSDDIRRVMKFECQISHPSTMFRKADFNAVGGYREFYTYAEDYDLWVRMMRRGDFVIFKEALTNYRIHPHQTSHLKGYQQQLATQAVRLDQKRFKKSKPDLGIKYQNLKDWSHSPQGKFYSFKIQINLLYARLRRRDSFLAVAILPFIAIVSPIHFWSKLFKRLQRFP